MTLQKDNLAEINARGYDFHWSFATNGYEWHGTPVIDKESIRDMYSYENVPYSKDDILDTLNIANVHEISPAPKYTQSPWLLKKGIITLLQSELVEFPGEGVFFEAQQDIPNRYYEPFSNLTLHRRFGSLNTKNLEPAILNFANKYGFLGRYITLNLPNNKQVAFMGESLYTWRNEIEKMGILLAIWDLLRNEEVGKLGQIISWCPSGKVIVKFKWQLRDGQYEISNWDGKRSNNPEGFGYFSESSDDLLSELSTDYTRGYSRNPARDFLISKLNLHLYGIRPKLFNRSHNCEVTYVPRTLLDVLWLMFMLEVQGKTKIARCKRCGEWFDFDRNTKTYCSGNCRRLDFYHRKSSEEGNHERLDSRKK